jgi:hexokinase
MEVLTSAAEMTPERCEALVNGILASMRNGLARDGEELKMLPSYVSKLSAAHGTFYALDLVIGPFCFENAFSLLLLRRFSSVVNRFFNCMNDAHRAQNTLSQGGTNFRVLRVELNESEPDRVRIKNYVIDPAHMQGTGEALFEFLAECIKDSVVSFGDESASLAEPIHLGFTFSFPCQQTSINAGTLLRWTKGFTATGVEGQDVVAMLQAALVRLDVHVHVEAVVNDTVGTLMARRRGEPNTVAGIILGTGTNGCYIEDLARLPKWAGSPRAGRMCVNMEWGNFGRDPASRALLPLTPADVALDAASLNPGEQIFEKLVGGM